MEGRLEGFLDLMFELQNFPKDHPALYVLLTSIKRYDVFGAWNKPFDVVKAEAKEWRQNACWGCAKKPSANERFQVCSGCRMASYCTGDCQKGHWPRMHKKECQPLKEVKKLFMAAIREREKLHADSQMVGMDFPELRKEWVVCMLPYLTGQGKTFIPDGHHLTGSYSTVMVSMGLNLNVLVDNLSQLPANVNTPVENKGPLMTLRGLSHEVVDSINVLRAFTPTGIVYNTYDTLLANGRKALTCQAAEWDPADTDIGRKHAEKLAALAEEKAVEVSVVRQAEVILRVKRARGFMHTIIGCEGSFMPYCLDEPEIWRRVKINRPGQFETLVAEFGPVKCLV